MIVVVITDVEVNLVAAVVSLHIVSKQYIIIVIVQHCCVHRHSLADA